MLRALLDPGSAAEIFRKTLPALNGQVPIRLKAVVPRDVIVKENWTVQTSIELEDLRSGVSRFFKLSSHHFSNGGLNKAVARIERQLKRIGCGEFDLGSLVSVVPEHRLLTLPFPLDVRIGHRLRRALDPTVARRQFRKTLPPHYSPSGSADDCRIQVLRYVPGRRCQICYRFSNSQGRPTEVLGKVFRDDRGRLLVHSMQEVADLFEREGDQRIAAPRPLAFLASWGMLIQEKSPGTTLYEMLRVADRTVEDCVVMAGRCIATLHDCALQVERTHGVGEELKLVQTVVRRQTALGFPDVELKRVAEKIATLGSSVQPNLLTPVHRDFYDKQLLVDNRRVHLIDLDTFALGCPELDVANFCAHLHLREVQGLVCNAGTVALCFLNSYSSRPGRALDQNLFAFFLATCYLRLACRYRLHPGSEEIFATFLGRASRAIRGIFDAGQGIRRMLQ